MLKRKEGLPEEQDNGKIDKFSRCHQLVFKKLEVKDFDELCFKLNISLDNDTTFAVKNLIDTLADTDNLFLINQVATYDNFQKIIANTSHCRAISEFLVKINKLKDCSKFLYIITKSSFIEKAILANRKMCEPFDFILSILKTIGKLEDAKLKQQSILTLLKLLFEFNSDSNYNSNSDDFYIQARFLWSILDSPALNYQNLQDYNEILLDQDPQKKMVLYNLQRLIKGSALENNRILEIYKELISISNNKEFPTKSVEYIVKQTVATNELSKLKLEEQNTSVETKKVELNSAKEETVPIFEEYKRLFETLKSHPEGNKIFQLITNILERSRPEFFGGMSNPLNPKSIHFLNITEPVFLLNILDTLSDLPADEGHHISSILEAYNEILYKCFPWTSKEFILQTILNKDFVLEVVTNFKHKSVNVITYIDILLSNFQPQRRFNSSEVPALKQLLKNTLFYSQNLEELPKILIEFLNLPGNYIDFEFLNLLYDSQKSQTKLSQTILHLQHFNEDFGSSQFARDLISKEDIIQLVLKNLQDSENLLKILSCVRYFLPFFKDVPKENNLLAEFLDLLFANQYDKFWERFIENFSFLTKDKAKETMEYLKNQKMSGEQFSTFLNLVNQNFASIFSSQKEGLVDFANNIDVCNKCKDKSVIQEYCRNLIIFSYQYPDYTSRLFHVISEIHAVLDNAADSKTPLITQSNITQLSIFAVVHKTSESISISAGQMMASMNGFLGIDLFIIDYDEKAYSPHPEFVSSSLKTKDGIVKMFIIKQWQSRKFSTFRKRDENRKITNSIKIRPIGIDKGFNFVYYVTEDNQIINICLNTHYTKEMISKNQNIMQGLNQSLDLILKNYQEDKIRITSSDTPDFDKITKPEEMLQWIVERFPEIHYSHKTESELTWQELLSIIEHNKLKIFLDLYNVISWRIRTLEVYQSADRLSNKDIIRIIASDKHDIFYKICTVLLAIGVLTGDTVNNSHQLVFYERMEVIQRKIRPAKATPSLLLINRSGENQQFALQDLDTNIKVDKLIFLGKDMLKFVPDLATKITLALLTGKKITINNKVLTEEELRDYTILPGDCFEIQ